MENNCTFSCRLEVLPGQWVLEKLENARRYGFDAVSLPGRYLESYLGELRECLSASPLPIVSMSLGFTGSLVSPDKEIRKKCTESLLRLFDICAGDSLVRGEPYGLICYGSRVELYLPQNATVHVRPGDHVRAGKTVVAEVPS